MQFFLLTSFTLYMTSARSWHMYNSFPFTVLYIARLSCSSSTSDSVVGVLFTLGVITGFSRFGCTSDSLPPSILVPIARSLCPGSKFCHPSSLILHRFQNLTSRSKHQTVIDMNENMCVCLIIVSEATWIRQEWVIIQTFQDTHEVLMPQFWCFAISVQCFVQFPHFIFFQSCITPLI